MNDGKMIILKMKPSDKPDDICKKL